MENKRIAIILIIFSVIFLSLGGTLAYWNWESDNTLITFSVDAVCIVSADVGGDVNPSNVSLAPSDCTSEKNAIKKKLTIYPTVLVEQGIGVDMWLDIKSIAPELSATENFKYALTTDENSCTNDVIVSGNFTGKQAGDTVDLLKQKVYRESIYGGEEYWLYIWLDAAETSLSTASKSFNFVLNGTCRDSFEGYNFMVNFDLNGGGSGTTTFTTVGESVYTVPEDGVYRLETWGASGGNSYGMKNGTVHKGGYGGYSVGEVSLTQDSKLYVNVGGQGTTTYQTSVNVAGGYNGGGSVVADLTWGSGHGEGTGGGATHIAKISGQLSTLESYKGQLYSDGSTYNSSNILIVAGGGGGAGDFYWSDNGVTRYGEGGSGGGFKGNLLGYDSNQDCTGTLTAATQITGGSFGSTGSFGQGGSHNAGGGGGFYGGGGCHGAGGGSGYIGSSLLSNKAMYCYNCATSDNPNTLTYSTNNVSSTPIANYAKSGNGAAKISKVDIPSEDVVVGESYGTLPAPTRNGYTFLGWNTNADGTGDMITNTSIVNISSDQTLYAIWGVGENKVWVSHYYRLNDSESVLISSDVVAVQSGSYTPEGITPPDGYYLSHFLYYTADENGVATSSGTNGSMGDSFSVNQNMLVHVYYRPITYTISYDGNCTGATNVPSAQSKYYGASLTLSGTTPTCSGYTFNGWNTSANGSGTNYSSGASYTSNENVTLYAKWTPIPYTVSYNACSGSGAPSTQSKNHGETLTLSSTIPTRNGYTFAGWATGSCSGGAVYSSGGSYTSNASVTLYAIWTAASSQTITLSGETYFRGGTQMSGYSYVGSDSDSTTYNWVVRYRFTTPAAGVRTISSVFNIIGKSSGTITQSNFYWHVTTSSTSHKNAYNSTGFSNLGALFYENNTFTGSKKTVSLAGNTTYYVYAWNAQPYGNSLILWNSSSQGSASVTVNG